MIPGLHHHREDFPPTTAATASARPRQSAAGRVAAFGVVGVGGGAVLPTVVARMQSASSRLALAATAGCLTGATKPSAPRPARTRPALTEAQTVAPGLVGAGPRTTARRCPAQSSPLTCASATFLAPAPSSPREPAQRRRTGIAPDRSAAANALSCARAADLTGPCYVERAASGVDVSSMAVALAAGALVLFVSVAIPLLREKTSQLAPPPKASSHACDLVLDEPEGVAGCSAPPRPPPACVVGGCQWWK